MIRKIIKVGGSYAITLPKKWVVDNAVEAGDYVFIPQLEKIKPEVLRK